MPDKPHTLGAQFEAKYDGRCPVCTLAVYEGDLMGWVDDVAVCDGCYNDAETENWQEIRANIRTQQEEERAKDPAKYDARQLEVKALMENMRANARAKRETEPQQEEAPVGVEPGIQALMAAGLLEGQEPGGSGVCNATLTSADGKITEVAIPVPPAAVEAPPVVIPSTGSVGDAAAAALARVRTPTKSGMVVSEAVAVGSPEFQKIHGDLGAEAAKVAADISLQESLRQAVDAGRLAPALAVQLGWVAPAAPQVTGVTPGRIAAPADVYLSALASAKSMPEEDAILGALDNLAPYEGMPGGVEEAKASIMAVIEDAITNHPRSLQKTIGPSEIGTECDHCLAAKLAGWEQVRDGSPWLPTVGTAVHTWLEEQAFMRAALDSFGRPRYLMERKVAVGTIGGVEITGSTDLVDLVRGMTWDWKIVGKTTLTSAKAGPSQRYKVQQMLYARGWRRLGILITHVGIAYLPRNEVSLRKAVLWTAEYDEALAVEALERADRMDANLKAMESISVEARDKFITGLPRWRSWKQEVGGIERTVYGNAAEGTIECLDCPRYADMPREDAEKVQAKQLEGLL